MIDRVWIYKAASSSNPWLTGDAENVLTIQIQGIKTYTNTEISIHVTYKFVILIHTETRVECFRAISTAPWFQNQLNGTIKIKHNSE
jgi:hypothetical protein